MRSLVVFLVSSTDIPGFCPSVSRYSLLSGFYRASLSMPGDIFLYFCIVCSTFSLLLVSACVMVYAALVAVRRPGVDLSTVRRVLLAYRCASVRVYHCIRLSVVFLSPLFFPALQSCLLSVAQCNWFLYLPPLLDSVPLNCLYDTTSTSTIINRKCRASCLNTCAYL